MFIRFGTWRANSYVADKWQLADKLTLNLGVRYDYKTTIREPRTALRPGSARCTPERRKTVLRAGFGKFYEFPSTQIISDLFAGPRDRKSFTFDTGEDLSATRGVLPTNACLLPGGSGGMAKISAACRAQLVDRAESARGR